MPIKDQYPPLSVNNKNNRCQENMRATCSSSIPPCVFCKAQYMIHCFKLEHRSSSKGSHVQSISSHPLEHRRQKVMTSCLMVREEVGV